MWHLIYQAQARHNDLQREMKQIRLAQFARAGRKNQPSPGRQDCGDNERKNRIFFRPKIRYAQSRIILREERLPC
jgi:hypothetical protein